MTVIDGYDGAVVSAIWFEHQEEWLKQHFELPGGIPLYGTFNRLIRTIKPDAFPSLLQCLITCISEQCGPTETNQIAIDGKVFRLSQNKGRSLGPLLLAGAWEHLTRSDFR